MGSTRTQRGDIGASRVKESEMGVQDAKGKK